MYFFMYLVKPLPQIWQAKFFLSMWILSIWYCKDWRYLNDLWHWWHKNCWASSLEVGWLLTLVLNLPISKNQRLKKFEISKKFREILPPGLIEGQALFRWCFRRFDCRAKLKPQVSHTWGRIPMWTSVSWAFKWYDFLKDVPHFLHLYGLESCAVSIWSFNSEL